MQIDVRLDAKAVASDLTRLQRRQLPFATALALTTTAKDVQRAQTRQIPQKLDRPVRFTTNAIGIKAATKRALYADVFVKRIQAAYLAWQIFGGTRRARNKGTGVPTRNLRLNQYGNIPNRRKGLVKNQRQFIATIKGITGVWERAGKQGRQLKLMVAFEPKVEYQPRYPFFEIANGVVRKKFLTNFSASLARALRTAR